MSLMSWRASYSVGHAEIDGQHKKIIELINALDDAMQAGVGKVALGMILDELITYTANHFAAEEKYMLDANYPAYDEHKAKHVKMTDKVLEIQSLYKKGTVGITIDVMKFLQDWLNKHILGTDMLYAPYIGKTV